MITGGVLAVAEQQPSFDATKYKLAQRDQWNKDAAAWHRWNPTLDRWVGGVTREMLNSARIEPAQQHDTRNKLRRGQSLTGGIAVNHLNCAPVREHLARSRHG